MLIGFVGDVHVNRPNPPEVFRHVRDVLKVPDILFGNLEGMYTDKPKPVPSALSIFSAPAHNLEVYPAAGFDVLSLANNHTIDVGYDAMLETRSRLRDWGIATCGAGAHTEEAHAPAVLAVDGVKIAFLAYSATFPVGCEARHDTPGLAPMRAHNIWREPFPTEYAPGLRPFASTLPDRHDMERLKSDLETARQVADFVITSFHWGDPTRSFFITDHEKRTAKYCIDHGADMVVGHHHHALRGMEWYKGKPIMYGLGHFVLDTHVNWNAGTQQLLEDESDLGQYFRQIDFAMAPKEGWPYLAYPEDTRMTALAWAQLGASGVDEIGFLPCRLQPDGSVVPNDPRSEEGQEIIAYVDRCNRSQGIKSKIAIEAESKFAGFDSVCVRPSC